MRKKKKKTWILIHIEYFLYSSSIYLNVNNKVTLPDCTRGVGIRWCRLVNGKFLVMRDIKDKNHMAAQYQELTNSKASICSLIKETITCSYITQPSQKYVDTLSILLLIYLISISFSVFSNKLNSQKYSYSTF